MEILQTRQNALISPFDAVDDPGIERADDGFVVEVVLFEEVRDYVHELKRGVFYKFNLSTISRSADLTGLSSGSVLVGRPSQSYS